MAEAGPTPPSDGEPPPAPHALGRSFADFPNLSTAETTLLRCCRKGEVANFGETRPRWRTDANRIRAGLVRFLCLGGDAQAPVHDQGVRIQGAWLEGKLDLDSVTSERRLSLVHCRIYRIEAAYSRFKSFNLRGSRLLRGMMGDGLCCDGGVILREGFRATGGVRLVRADIGDLDCSDGRFEWPTDAALDCDRATIPGGAFFRDGFSAKGMVRLNGATIGSHLDCRNGSFRSGLEGALLFSAATIAGSVLLHKGFNAAGGVRLVGATISGDLDCSGRFEKVGAADALCCRRARVGGGLLLQEGADIRGAVDLGSMRVAALCDIESAWTGAAGQMVLDGFVYERLAGDAPTEAEARIRWLENQTPDHLAQQFRPQPWEQLIKVLREMGHPNEARTIAVKKQERLRQAGRIPAAARPFHWLYGALVGYGYRPWRLVRVTLCVWILWTLFYLAATNPAPGRPHLLAPPPSREGNVPKADYGNFVPVIYSADVLLPVIDFGYREEWVPVVRKAGKSLPAGQILRFLYWFEIAFGWVAGLLLVGVLGSLIKKD